MKESYDRTLVEDLNEVTATLSEATEKLCNALLWKQIDGGMDPKNISNFVVSLGNETDRANEKVESIKATSKAKGIV